MQYLATIIWILAGLRLLVAAANLLTRQWLKPIKPVEEGMLPVSKAGHEAKDKGPYPSKTQQETQKEMASLPTTRQDTQKETASLSDARQDTQKEMTTPPNTRQDTQKEMASLPDARQDTQKEMSSLPGQEGRLEGEMISVLIPARNEGHRIGLLLKGLTKQDHKHWEAIVYDDESQDNTARIVEEAASGDQRIRLMKGQGLPAGWTGKNHACHELAKQATGDYLLFLDADVLVGEQLLSQAIAHTKKHKLSLLSIFPKQVMYTLGERLSVPIMNWILLSSLPLILTRRLKAASLAAANGQFMLFHGKTYHHNQFHLRVKDKSTEDIAIARHMKQRGLRLHTILGSQQIRCRMYSSGTTAIRGFTKNILAIFGDKPWLALAFALLTTAGALPVYLSFGAGSTAAYLTVIMFIRILVSISSRQNLAWNILLAPAQQAVFTYITLLAITKKLLKKGVLWKGRVIYN